MQMWAFGQKPPEGNEPMLVYECRVEADGDLFVATVKQIKTIRSENESVTHCLNDCAEQIKDLINETLETNPAAIELLSDPWMGDYTDIKEPDGFVVSLSPHLAPKPSIALLEETLEQAKRLVWEGQNRDGVQALVYHHEVVDGILSQISREMKHSSVTEFVEGLIKEFAEEQQRKEDDSQSDGG